MQKRCSRCGETKSADQFSRRKINKDGLYSWCKPCAAEQKRNSPIQAESARRRAAQWYRDHPEEAARYRRTAYEANIEERRRQSAEWYRDNRARAADAGRKWRDANRDRVRDLEQSNRAKRRGQFVEHVDRLVLFDDHGGICGICKQPVGRDSFDVDHVVPTSRGGQHSYANTQPAHPKCNQSKRNKLMPLPVG